MFWAEAAAMEVTSVVTVMPITSIGLIPRLKRVWRRINKANGSPNSQADGCPGAVLSSTFGGGRKYDLTVLGLRLADDSTIMVGRSAPLPLVGCLMLSVDYRCTWRTAAPGRGSPVRSDSRCGRCGLPSSRAAQMPVGTPPAAPVSPDHFRCSR